MTTNHRADFQGYQRLTHHLRAALRPLLLPLWLILFLSLSTSVTKASGTGTWFSYAINGKLNERWAVTGDYQFRDYAPFRDFRQLLLRTFGQYSVNEKLEFGAGYVFSLQGQPGLENTATSIEHRPTQQAIYRYKNTRLQTVLRARFEQRFIGTGSPLLRIRMFGGALWRLGKDSDWSLAATDEVFWYTEGMTFDQNRTFFGVSCRINDHLRIETGGLLISQNSTLSRQVFTQLVHHFNW